MISRHPLEQILFDRRITYKQLAVTSGITPSTITRFIQGHDIYLTAAVKIAKALDISIEQLLSSSESPPNHSYPRCDCIRCLVIG